MTTSAAPLTTNDEADSTPGLDPDTALFGSDPTAGIVSVSATCGGDARVWRREADGSTAVERRRFSPWLLVSDADILGGLAYTSLLSLIHI